MTSEQIYDLVAYFMKEDAGLPCRYDELTFEQRAFIDALVENFESDADEKISNLELIISDLERELIESEIEHRQLVRDLQNTGRSLV